MAKFDQSTLPLLALAATAAATTAASPPMTNSTPFVSGEDGYHTYRIPSLARLPTGELLLFAEGRKLSSADHDWNDVRLFVIVCFPYF